MPKLELVFPKPICNASGMLGFSPAPSRMPFLDQIGAFFTNPISLHARTPAATRGVIRFPGGILLHSGYPNPGLRKVLEKHVPRWENSPIPIVPHVMADPTSPLESLLRPLEEITNLMAVEVSFPPDWTDSDILRCISTVTSELPLILSLEPDRIAPLLPRLKTLDVSAISMAARRGTLQTEAGQLITGRLYGPSLFPQTLHLLRDISGNELPILASGGLFSQEQIKHCMQAGAAAIQLDTALWSITGSTSVFEFIPQE